MSTPMTCTQVPKDFHDRLYTVLEQRFSNIQSIDDNTTMYGLTVAPSNLETQHKFYTIGSEEHIEDLIELHYILDLLRKFTEKHNITYSLAFGNLLGYYRENGQIFWDDDIDVLMTLEQYNNLITILCNTTNDKWKYCPYWTDYGWGSTHLCKEIVIEGVKLILVKQPMGFMKIKLDYNCIERDIGGLDIFSTTYAFKNDKHIIATNLLDKNNLELIEYHTVPTYACNQVTANQLLDLMYGDTWNIRMHPSLQK